MGAVLAKCLPPSTRNAIADTIPDREVLIKWAERVAAFEEELKIKKEKAAVKKMQKNVKKLRALAPALC